MNPKPSTLTLRLSRDSSSVRCSIPCGAASPILRYRPLAMSDREDNDSDAPEEFTAEQGFIQDEELRKQQREHKERVIVEGKERRKRWAERKTPRKPKVSEDVQEVVDGGTEDNKDENEAALINKGMLPNDIVQLLAAREKQVLSSDSEDEKTEEKSKSRKKKHKTSGSGPIILKEIPAPPCLQSSMEFLKKRKMQVQRSNSVLHNANQALRLISSGSGLLSKK